MKPPFTITDKILNQMITITEKVSRISLYRSRDLRLRKASRIKSIQSSLAIENNTLTLAQVTEVIAGKRVLGPPKDIKEVQNAYAAYDQVFQSNPYEITHLLAAHQLMTESLVSESGTFRSRDVGVYDENGGLVHMGARPQYIYGLVEDLLEWAESTETPALIKSCVVHFELEMIHPFADGNGRVGRLWQNLILAKWQPIFEWIPIETMIYRHQKAYYQALSQGDVTNDGTVFIEFMLAVINEALSEFPTGDLIEEIGFFGEGFEQLSNQEFDFYELIYPYLKVKNEIWNAKAVQLSGKSAGTVRRYFSKLVAVDLLVSTGNNKNRRYSLK